MGNKGNAKKTPQEAMKKRDHGATVTEMP